MSATARRTRRAAAQPVDYSASKVVGSDYQNEPAAKPAARKRARKSKSGEGGDAELTVDLDKSGETEGKEGKEKEGKDGKDGKEKEKDGKDGKDGKPTKGVKNSKTAKSAKSVPDISSESLIPTGTTPKPAVKNSAPKSTLTTSTVASRAKSVAKTGESPKKAASPRRRKNQQATVEANSDLQKLEEFEAAVEKNDYKQLVNVAVVDVLELLRNSKAEENFAAYKVKTKQKEETSRELINELKKKIELLEQSASLNENAKTSQQSEALTEKIGQLERENNSLKQKLESSLLAQKDLLDQLTKLQEESRKADRSLLVSPSRRNSLAKSANAGLHLLKEDFYSQVCGLDINGVQCEDNQIVFDCAQSGPLGTVEYKLYIPQVEEDEESSSVEQEVTYDPQIDLSQQPELKDVLPDYFLESLSFSPDSVMQFYLKLARILQKS